MTQVAPRQTGRISQLLPTVKCSNCNSEVPLNDLGDHVCPRVPPMPTQLPRPPRSPNSATALLPPRLQNRVPIPPPAVGQQYRASPPPSPTRESPQRRGNNSPLPRTNSPAGNPRFRGEQRPSPLSMGYTRPPSANDSRGNNYPEPGRPRDPWPPQSPGPTSVHREPEPDTKSGGAAGMAGVGRRGFAAAARAAMLASNAVNAMSSYNAPSYNPPHGMSTTPNLNQSMVRNGTPRLELNTPYRPPSRGATTPSLSPGTSSNPQSPPFPRSPSDPRDGLTPSSASPPSTGRSQYFDRYRNDSPDYQKPMYAENHIDSGRYNVSDKLQANIQAMNSPISSGSEYAPTPESTTFDNQKDPHDPSSGSEYGGLAYADSTYTDSEDEVTKPPVRSTSVHRTPRTSPDGRGRIRRSLTRSPSGKLKDDDEDRRPVRATPQRRPTNASTASSSGSVVAGRSVSMGTSASNYSHNTMSHRRDTFQEDDRPRSSSSSRRSGPALPLSPKQERIPRLPVRSRTSPSPAPTSSAFIPSSPPTRLVKTMKEKDTNAAASARRAEKKKKVCTRCEKTIENGKWVQMDGGSVLCEVCWKNMYLPKCRRCNLAIEKAAVSSSDGQLKGKYHKECFNCTTCHKPFPDKSFYVFDGKPFCGYHYHEANDSLCAAATCGQPIEGPCAVSHVGDRYHPEHMLCEYPGYPKCRERLSGDYYEVDGRMLCERHAANGARYDDDFDERVGGGGRRRTGERTKRTTRMITLGLGRQ